jgi:hypothetical protein
MLIVQPSFASLSATAGTMATRFSFGLRSISTATFTGISFTPFYNCLRSIVFIFQFIGLVPVMSGIFAGYFHSWHKVGCKAGVSCQAGRSLLTVRD